MKKNNSIFIASLVVSLSIILYQQSNKQEDNDLNTNNTSASVNDEIKSDANVKPVQNDKFVENSKLVEPLENAEKMPGLELEETSDLLDSQIKIEQALEHAFSEDVNARIQAIQTLVTLSPIDAVDTIYELLNNLDSDEISEGMAVLGLLSLANDKEALTNEDLEYIFNSYENDNIRARSARVLAHRGDESLLQDYVKKYEGVLPQDLESKNKKLMELANLQSKVALPYISMYLDDADEVIRLTALSAIEMTASAGEIELVRPLLYDSDPAVRQRSEEVINNLLARGKNEAVPTDILLNPPRT